jgi:hypothetical protein
VAGFAAEARLELRPFNIVMAGLDPAIHDLLSFEGDVDARDKPGHDERNEGRE